MKVTINGKVNKEVLNTILEEQKEKTKQIETFCKTNKITKLIYKDQELEYEYEFKKLVKTKEVESR